MSAPARILEELDRAIRFAGDSGDGMQPAGDQFTQETAVYGDHLSTLPDLPAEIRAPDNSAPAPALFRRTSRTYDISL